MSDYDPAQLVHDANEFADSRFGAHYMERLEAAKQRAVAQTMDKRLTDSERAHAGTVAATLQAEINYFNIARTVKVTPSLMDKLRRKFKEKEATDIDV